VQRTVETWRAQLAALRRQAAQGVPVWDRGVRAFHWLLAASVLVAGLTGFFATRSLLTLHLISGTAIAALVGWRIVWGLLGPGYARFASFWISPRATLDYARGAYAGHARRYLGHNPLGAAMVFALLGVLALISVTGVIALGGELKQGPFASFFNFTVGDLSLGLHNFLAGLLVALVVSHLAGVGFETWRERENLALAMVTGRKLPESGAAAVPWRARLWLAGAICLIGGAGAAAGLTLLAHRPVAGLPSATLDPAYARECGACHFALPPSIATAATWQAIMDHLDQHFGEDASLSPDVAQHIRAWLTAHAAERYDTLPSVRLTRRIDPTQPLRVTATGFWRRVHEGISDAVFADRKVGGRVECNACHRDAASGLFAPQSIEVPESAE
jgi:cytochrome b